VIVQASHADLLVHIRARSPAVSETLPVLKVRPAGPWPGLGPRRSIEHSLGSGAGKSQRIETYSKRPPNGLARQSWLARRRVGKPASPEGPAPPRPGRALAQRVDRALPGEGAGKSQRVAPS